MEFKYSVLAKSGKCGHYDYDGNSLIIDDNFVSTIPLAVGNILVIKDVEYIVDELEIVRFSDESFNRCYVVRMYEGEEWYYIKWVNIIADAVKSDDNEQLKSLLLNWEKHKDKHNIRRN